MYTWKRKRRLARQCKAATSARPCLYVVGLPGYVTGNYLRSIVAQYGNIDNATVLELAHGVNDERFAMVAMTTSGAAALVMERLSLRIGKKLTIISSHSPEGAVCNERFGRWLANPRVAII